MKQNVVSSPHYQKIPTLTSMGAALFKRMETGAKELTGLLC
ncbi:hypothetical protein [Bacillus sp. FJAT-44742]|nr:hypothetical protein [Bacillus sp. FJAT-44742]